VTRLWSELSRNRHSISSRSIDCSLHRIQVGFVVDAAPYRIGPIFPEIKQPRYEANHPPLLSVEDRNARSCISTPPYILMTPPQGSTSTENCSTRFLLHPGPSHNISRPLEWLSEANLHKGNKHKRSYSTTKTTGKSDHHRANLKNMHEPHSIGIFSVHCFSLIFKFPIRMPNLSLKSNVYLYTIKSDPTQF
jgi:hypothetical protein